MLRAAMRNLLAHKLRLLLSGAAVVLGVAFIAGTMIFTDTLEKTFSNLFESTAADVNVEPRAAFETGLAGTGVGGGRQTVPASVVDQIAEVDGVAAAAGTIAAEGVYVLDPDGEVLGTGGAPGIGVNWIKEEEVRTSTLTEGRAPERSGEVALDSGTAESTGYGVGDTVTLLTTGPKIDAEVVGIFRYGESGGLAGATLTAFDTDAAQTLLLDEGEFSGVAVAAEDGVSDAALSQRIATTIGNGYDVKTRAEQVKDLATSLEESLSFINTFLLVFAGVALFVGSFLILNTFSMLVAQRTRELGLLRALGASRRQVTSSVLLEALVMGVAGAVAGLGVGYGLAHLLKLAFEQLGLTLDAALVFNLGTVLWALAIGVVVTLVAAYLPARRAAKVPPIAAMREDQTAAPRSLARRVVIGVPLAVLGGAALVLGPSSFEGSTAGAMAGLGAVALIVGAITLSPVLAVPFIRLFGWVLPRLAGKTGHLARENALRNPQRTAATSSALMIGLALVTGFSIIGSSASASTDELIDESLKAEYVVSSGVEQPFTPEVAEKIRGVEGVQSVTSQRFGVARIGGQEAFFSAFDAGSMASAVELTMVEGDPAGLRGDGLLVDEPTAKAQGLAIGDSVRFLSTTGGEATLTVRGIFVSTGGATGSYLVSMQTYNATGGVPLDRYLYVDVSDSEGSGNQVRAALEDITAAYPVVALKDQGQFKDEQRAQVDQLLLLINALLVLSVLIAVLGVVNTLVLSVIERTRELGLLRAIGMSRRQVRRMVRLESVVISVYGAVLGVALGTFFGVSLTKAVSDQGFTQLVIPYAELAAFLVLGAVIGMLAAAFPARRAGRLRILDAIATE